MKQAVSPLRYLGPGTVWEERNAPRGSTFEVVQTFVDADGDQHKVGERWTVIGTGFDKFENVMWIGLCFDDGAERLMPLEWRVNKQGHVLDNWKSYVQALG